MRRDFVLEPTQADRVLRTQKCGHAQSCIDKVDPQESSFFDHASGLRALLRDLLIYHQVSMLFSFLFTRAD